MRRLFVRRAWAAGVAFAASTAAIVGVQPSAAGAAPVATVLDSVSPVDVAAYGDALAWLRPVSAGGRGAARPLLVVRDGRDAATRALDITLPKGTDGLTLGLDARRRPTVVLSTPRGLYSMATQGSSHLRRVPGTISEDSAPGLRRGELAFARKERIGGREQTTVRLGSLTSRRSRVLWAGAPNTAVNDTALGSAHSVVFITDRAREDAGADLYARLIRPGQRSRKLLRQISGEGAGASGFGRSTVSADGGQVTTVRWDESGGHPNDVTVFSLPAGRQLAQSRQPDPPGEASFVFELLPLTSGGSAVAPDLGSGFYLLG